MPFVEVKLIGPVTDEVKKAIAMGITDVIEKEAGKPREYIWVKFDEVDRKDWMIAGKTL